MLLNSKENFVNCTYMSEMFCRFKKKIIFFYGFQCSIETEEMVVCYEDTQITVSKHVKQMESFINFVRCMCSII